MTNWLIFHVDKVFGLALIVAFIELKYLPANVLANLASFN